VTYQLNAPAKNGSLEVLVVGKGTSFKNLDRVDDGHASVQFAAWNVVIEILGRSKAGVNEGEIYVEKEQHQDSVRVTQSCSAPSLGHSA
jgi:hypothetical protein